MYGIPALGIQWPRHQSVKSRNYLKPYRSDSRN
jgi:hypothetical protein